MSLNPSDVSKYSETFKTQRHPLSLVERSDQAVNIIEIYREMGGQAPEGSYRSYKIHCPFNYEHGDGGLDKNCRIYPPSHIYCFASHGIMKPTYLYSRWKGIQLKQAAAELLEQRGLLKPKFYTERWQELMEQRQTLQTSLGTTAEAVAVLQADIATNEQYKSVEFSKPVREAWTIILAALEVLWSRPQTDLNALRRWHGNSLNKLNSAVSEALTDQGNLDDTHHST